MFLHSVAVFHLIRSPVVRAVISVSYLMLGVETIISIMSTLGLEELYEHIVFIIFRVLPGLSLSVFTQKTFQVLALSLVRRIANRRISQVIL